MANGWKMLAVFEGAQRTRFLINSEYSSDPPPVFIWSRNIDGKPRLCVKIEFTICLFIWSLVLRKVKPPKNTNTHVFHLKLTRAPGNFLSKPGVPRYIWNWKLRQDYTHQSSPCPCSPPSSFRSRIFRPLPPFQSLFSHPSLNPIWHKWPSLSKICPWS